MDELDRAAARLMTGADHLLFALALTLNLIALAIWSAS